MPKSSTAKTLYALSLAGQLGFMIAMPIGGFLLLGSFMDRWLDMQPLFLMVGLAVGLTVTAYEVYHMLLPILRKENDD